MKFKRNEGRINALIILSLILFICILPTAFCGLETKIVLLFFGVGLLIILAYILSIKGLFCDMVYCDEKGIKIVTREKTSEYTWIEIFRIQVIPGRRGPIGWTVVALDGEKFDLFPEPMNKFTEYVKAVSPYLEIKTWN